MADSGMAAFGLQVAMASVPFMRCASYLISNINAHRRHRVPVSMFCDSSIRERTPMPIRPSLRWFYPIDWPQLSREFGLAARAAAARPAAAVTGRRCYACRMVGGSIATKPAGVTATGTGAFRHGAHLDRLRVTCYYGGCAP